VSIDGTEPPISGAVALAAVRELQARMEVSSNISHPGEAGRARENLIREFLETFCPKGFTLSTGFVFDAQGAVSRQQDIVIFRDSYHPVFRIGGISYFPIESVAAVIEVKSAITSVALLQDALDCIASVKRLDRTGKGKNYVVNGNMQYPFKTQLHDHQVFSSIVALKGTASSTAVRTVAQWCRGNKREEWPNWIVSVFEYSIGYATPGGIPPCDNMNALGVASLGSHPENTIPVIDFLRVLVSFLRVTPIVDFKPDGYFPSSSHHENFESFDDKTLQAQKALRPGLLVVISQLGTHPVCSK
jgi:hypothetical protein